MICPADGWYAICTDGNKETKTPLILWCESESGAIDGLVAVNAEICTAAQLPGFIGYHMEATSKPAKSAGSGGKSNARNTGKNCPKCGSALVERDGKWGPWVACSGYPACKYKPGKEDDSDNL